MLCRPSTGGPTRANPNDAGRIVVVLVLLHADGSGACGSGSALGTCFAASSSPPACARWWRRSDAQSVRMPPLLRPMLGAQASIFGTFTGDEHQPVSEYDFSYGSR